MAALRSETYEAPKQVPLLTDNFEVAKKAQAATTGTESSSTQDAGLGVMARLAKEQAKATVAQADTAEDNLRLKVRASDAAQKAKVQAEGRGLNAQSLNMRQNMQEQTAKLLQSHEQNRDKVSIGRYKSNSELLGFTLRLQDTEYVDKIQMEGKKARLDNSIAMKEAIQNAVFKDEIDLFQSSIYFKQLLNMDARQFQQALSTMDIDSAMKLASSQNDAANSAMLIQTGSQVLSDAAGLYAKYKSKK